MENKEDKKVIGQRLATARKELGLTQKGLADKAGIPLPTIKDYEAGKSMPGSKAMQKYAGVGVNIGWVLEGDGPALLEGEARQAHVDMIGDVLVRDPAAAYRRKARGEENAAEIRKIKLQSRFVRDLIEAGETALEREKLILAPADKGQFYSLLYEMFSVQGYPENQAPITTDNVIPFVKGVQLKAKK